MTATKLQMNNTNQVNAIVDNNNNGASLIDKGDYPGAISSLTIALHAAKCYMSEEVAETGADHNGCHHGVRFDLDSLMMEETMTLQSFADDEDGFFVYGKPIRIPEASLMQQEEELLHCVFHRQVLCLAVPIFNLALAHHLCALSRPNSHSDIIFKKGAKLYDFGLQVLLGADNGLVPSKCGFIYLAILNNLGDIHRRLQNTLVSEYCCHELLHYLSDCKQIQSSAKRALDTFYQNSFFYLLSTRGTNATPAA